MRREEEEIKATQRKKAVRENFRHDSTSFFLRTNNLVQSSAAYPDEKEPRFCNGFDSENAHIVKIIDCEID